MGINPISLAWLVELQNDHGLFRDATVAELGPQDIRAPAHIVRTLLGIPSDQPIPVVALAAYGLMGAREYCSFDSSDARATVKLDLNRPLEPSRRFDVVTNFGTAEHVFNIGEVFRTVHKLTRPGGVMLHNLPALGHIDHGFWNIHPKTYVSLAEDNGYELLSLWYVPDVVFTCFDIEDGRVELDVEPFKAAGAEAFGTHRYSIMAGLRLARNTNARYQAGYFQRPSFGVVDYCQVALRKVHDRPFVCPFERSRPESDS
jgi:SAM-dependent methyltransferase